PVPSISWRRVDGSPFPGKMKINQSNGVLEIPYFRPDDAGFYECVAENSRGRSVAKGDLVFNDVEHLHWAQTLRDAKMAIDSDLHWECRANGKPQPVYRWLKNGQAMVSEDRIHINAGKLMLSKVNLEDSGMYQCLAENKHSVIYASAELKVVASPPDFSKGPVRKSTLVQRGGEVIIECQPHASPKPSFTWRKEGNLLQNNGR
ncbi:contactin-4, partial [Tachysurus ichikawai]